MAKIEEKAKAYNGNYKAFTELIDRLEDVKEAIKKQNYGIAMDILYKPYPEFQITTSTELKESEDERIRKALLELVHDTTGDELWVDYNVHKEDAIAWLEKQGDQKPADTEKGAKGNERKIPNSVWSEEDDKLLELSVDNLTELKNRFGKEYGRTGDCINWLKFLKEIYTWKPSDEQMKALKEAVDEHFDIDGGALWHLYKDLKKLREE